jgi:FkbM family methyltransferase
MVRALHYMAEFIESAYENEEWDMAVNGEAALLRRLQPAGFTTVLDVGAHVGDWSVEALLAWPSSQVHAFEVAAPTYEELTRRVAAAGVSARLILNPVGLSDRTTTRDMYFFPDHPQLTCDMPRHAEHRATRFQAQLLKGDTYAAQHGLARIDFVKIDVEGAEHLVIRGFHDTIESGRLDCIQFEYGAFSLQTRVLLADYYDLLGSRYWIGKIYPTHVEFKDYDWRMESFRFVNFLCVSRSRPDLQALARGLT